MASNNVVTLNRQQLAELFKGNQLAVIAFDALFKRTSGVSTVLTDTTVQFTADNAAVQASQALSDVARLAADMLMSFQFANNSDQAQPDNYLTLFNQDAVTPDFYVTPDLDTTFPDVYIPPSQNDVNQPTEFYCYLAANYALTSSITSQKAFNTSTNGALRLDPAEYLFEWLYFVDSMSATSGNALFDIKGAGTATIAATERFMSLAIDAAANTITAPSMSYNSAVTTTPQPVATAAITTSLATYMRGAFTVTAAGTIIPSLTLGTAAAAIAGKGSFIKVSKIVANNLVGPWS